MGNSPDTELGRRLLATLFALGATSADDDEDDDEEEEEEEESKSGKGEDSEVKRVRAEAKRRRLELREERKAREKVEAELKELKDREKTDLEKTGTELEEARKRLAELEPGYQEAQRELAFFKSGLASQFQNPAHALRLIDLKDIDLDSDADEMTASIKEKAEALLKEAPYLKANAAGGGEEGNGDGGEGGGSQPPPDTTGAGDARGRKGKRPDDTAALVKRFPALAGRIDTGQQS